MEGIRRESDRYDDLIEGGRGSLELEYSTTGLTNMLTTSLVLIVLVDRDEFTCCCVHSYMKKKKIIVQ